jgi:hypothetical protein
MPVVGCAQLVWMTSVATISNPSWSAKMRYFGLRGCDICESALFNMVYCFMEPEQTPEIPLEHSLTLKIGSFGNKWPDGAPCG